MQIARFIQFYSGEYGGPVNHIDELTKHLRPYKVNNVVYTSSDLNAAGNKQKIGVEQVHSHLSIKRFQTIFRFREYRITKDLITNLSREIGNIDILHSHAIRSYQDDIATLFALRKKKPLVITPHGALDVNFSIYDKFPKDIYDYSLGFLKKIQNIYYIAVAKIEVEFIKQWGIPESRILYIPHGVDTDHFRPIKSERVYSTLELSENTPLVLYVGRVAKRKGIGILIKAFKKTLKEVPSAKLFIAGNDFGYKNEMFSLIKQKNLEDSVKYLGFIPKSSLPELYSLAQVVVYPSYKEIFGHVILEANACGKPIIATNEWGPKQLITPGLNGYLCNYGDISAIAEKITLLLKDRDLAIKLGNWGRQSMIKNYSWERNAEKHYALYKKIINS